MALDPKNLGRQDTTFDGYPRLFAKHNDRLKVVALAGAPVLPPAFPLMEVGTSGTYQPWEDGAEIVALTHGCPQETSGADECLIVAAIRGEVHWEDVVLPAGQTQGALETALRSGLLNQRGIIVRELPNKSL